MYLPVVYGSVFAGGWLAGQRLEEATGGGTVPATSRLSVAPPLTSLQTLSLLIFHNISRYLFADGMFDCNWCLIFHPNF